MRQRRFIFLVVCLLMFYGKNFSQQKFSKNSLLTHFLTVKPLYQHPVNPEFGTQPPGIPLSPLFFRASLYHTASLSGLLSPGNYQDQLGFFCRTEWQFEKRTGLPLRFRLGSIDYVNYLEQKPNAAKPQ